VITCVFYPSGNVEVHAKASSLPARLPLLSTAWWRLKAGPAAVHVTTGGWHNQFKRTALLNRAFGYFLNVRRCAAPDTRRAITSVRCIGGHDQRFRPISQCSEAPSPTSGSAICPS